MLFGQPIWKLIIEFYIVFVLAYFLIKVVVSNRRMIAMALVFLLILAVSYLVQLFELEVATSVLNYIMNWLPAAFIIVMAPDIRRYMDIAWKADQKNEHYTMGNQQTKNHIIEAVMELSRLKIGALITVEKHQTLEQYAERAIMMNSRVSKELLLNIFTPLTPLHDGAVIIRGDEILCAGAYYVLSDNEGFEKSTGSRHRAGLGISEVTDSMTIIVSEETGQISIAIEGILMRNNDREKLVDYLNMFMK